MKVIGKVVQRTEGTENKDLKTGKIEISINDIEVLSSAKELPLPLDPEITRMEYDMKDQLIRQTIMTTQEDVKEIKEQMIRMEDKIDKLN